MVGIMEGGLTVSGRYDGYKHDETWIIFKQHIISISIVVGKKHT